MTNRSVWPAAPMQKEKLLHDKGKPVMDACQAGCIGCTLCVKQCENGAIEMDNNIPVIDYNKCTGCGKCAEKCPKKVIHIA